MEKANPPAATSSMARKPRPVVHLARRMAIAAILTAAFLVGQGGAGAKPVPGIRCSLEASSCDRRCCRRQTRSGARWPCGTCSACAELGTKGREQTREAPHRTAPEVEELGEVYLGCEGGSGTRAITTRSFPDPDFQGDSGTGSLAGCSIRASDSGCARNARPGRRFGTSDSTILREHWDGRGSWPGTAGCHSSGEFYIGCRSSGRAAPHHRCGPDEEVGQPGVSFDTSPTAYQSPGNDAPSCSPCTCQSKCGSIPYAAWCCTIWNRFFPGKQTIRRSFQDCGPSGGKTPGSYSGGWRGNARSASAGSAGICFSFAGAATSKTPRGPASHGALWYPGQTSSTWPSTCTEYHSRAGAGCTRYHSGRRRGVGCSQHLDCLSGAGQAGVACDGALSASMHESLPNAWGLFRDGRLVGDMRTVTSLGKSSAAVRPVGRCPLASGSMFPGSGLMSFHPDILACIICTDTSWVYIAFCLRWPTSDLWVWDPVASLAFSWRCPLSALRPLPRRGLSSSVCALLSACPCHFTQLLAWGLREESVAQGPPPCRFFLHVFSAYFSDARHGPFVIARMPKISTSFCRGLREESVAQGPPPTGPSVLRCQQPRLRGSLLSQPVPCTPPPHRCSVCLGPWGLVLFLACMLRICHAFNCESLPPEILYCCSQAYHACFFGCHRPVFSPSFNGAFGGACVCLACMCWQHHNNACLTQQLLMTWTAHQAFAVLCITAGTLLAGACAIPFHTLDWLPVSVPRLRALRVGPGDARLTMLQPSRLASLSRHPSAVSSSSQGKPPLLCADAG